MSYIDDNIVSMRKSKAYIRTILDYVIGQQPLLDEQVCLARVLDVLDKNNLAVSRNEVRTAFNKYYVKDFHGDKQSYITWLCDEFHVKRGTLVNGSQIRSQASEKKAISQTRGHNLGVRTANKERNKELYPKPLQGAKNQINEVFGDERD